MLQINITPTASLCTVTAAVSGVMLGMALEAWIRDTGRRLAPPVTRRKDGCGGVKDGGHLFYFAFIPVI